MGEENNAMTLEEMKRMKSNCCAKGDSLWYTTVSRHGYACALNLCFESMPETTETRNAIMRYMKLLTFSSTVARRGFDDWGVLSRFLL